MAELMETGEVLETMALKSPYMQSILTAARKRRAKKLEEARKQETEILRFFGKRTEKPLTDDALLTMAEAYQEQLEYLSACETCTYTVANCHECRYNGEAFIAKRYTDEYFAKLPACGKFNVQRQQKRTEKLLGQSGIGERFRSRTFDTFRVSTKTQSAFDICRAFCKILQENPKAKGIMLVGSYGCGKTHLAAAILQEVAEAGIAGLFVVVTELLAKIRATFDSRDGSAEEIIERAKNTPLLILDDIGAEKASEWTQEQLYRIVNFRYEHLLPTVITTNCDGAQLEMALGRRIVSRLIEMTTPVKVQAADYRMAGGVGA